MKNIIAYENILKTKKIPLKLNFSSKQIRFYCLNLYFNHNNKIKKTSIPILNCKVSLINSILSLNLHYFNQKSGDKIDDISREEIIFSLFGMLTL